jgi:chromosome segregation ATPase
VPNGAGDEDAALSQATRRLEAALDRLRAAMRGGTLDAEAARRALEEAERELAAAKRRLEERRRRGGA